jgi:hypothetical protein
MTLHRGEFEKRTSGAKSAEAESDGSEEDEVQESAALRFGLAVHTAPPPPLLPVAVRPGSAAGSNRAIAMPVPCSHFQSATDLYPRTHSTHSAGRMGEQ